MTISASTALPSSLMPERGLLLALRALEGERLGHHADGQRAAVARDLRDDGRRAGAGAAAHAGGHEDHVGAGERLGDARGVLQRGGAADLRVGAGAEPLGQVAAEVDLGARQAGLQHLTVGVGDDEVDAFDAGLDHRVERVAAATAYTDDLDDGTAGTLSIVVEFEHRKIDPMPWPTTLIFYLFFPRPDGHRRWRSRTGVT